MARGRGRHASSDHELDPAAGAGPGASPFPSLDPNDPSAWPDEISLDYFYKPHTVTILLLSIAGLVVTAFVRDDADYRSNIFAGLCGVTAFFLVISALAFPNGPFVRPHPILWRMVFGLSVIYLLMVQFLIHQVGTTTSHIFGFCTNRLAFSGQAPLK